MIIIALIAGMFIGASLGYILCAALTINKEREEDEQNRLENIN